MSIALIVGNRICGYKTAYMNLRIISLPFSTRKKLVIGTIVGP